MALHLSTLVLPLRDRAASAGEVIAMRCAAACDGQPGLLAQWWVFNARTGTVGGLLHWSDAAACASQETTILGRLTALIPSRVAPSRRTYARASSVLRAVCATQPTRLVDDWDHYEI